MRVAAALLALGLLGGCDLSMDRQPRHTPQGGATLWPGGPPADRPPEGTVSATQPAREAALASPPPLTRATVERGRERYGIFCIMCHGAGGDGNGVVVQRGFPPPPSFHIARLVAAPPAYIVDVITHGHGVMYSYADRVDPQDRWAIAAYVKALQRAKQDREAVR